MCVCACVCVCVCKLLVCLICNFCILSNCALCFNYTIWVTVYCDVVNVQPHFNFSDEVIILNLCNVKQQMLMENQPENVSWPQNVETANILICCLFGGSINIYVAEVPFCFEFKLLVPKAVLVCSLLMENRYGLVHDVILFFCHPGFMTVKLLCTKWQHLLPCFCGFWMLIFNIGDENLIEKLLWIILFHSFDTS